MWHTKKCQNFSFFRIRSGRWPRMFFMILGTYRKQTFIDFSLTQRIQLMIFWCHTVTHGTDLRRSPPLVALHFTPVSKSLGHSFGLASLRGLRACLKGTTITMLYHTSMSSTTMVYGRESWQSRTRRSPWRASSLGTGTTTFFSWSLNTIFSVESCSE